MDAIGQSIVLGANVQLNNLTFTGHDSVVADHGKPGPALLITPLCPSADFPIEFLCGGTHISACPRVGAWNAAGEKKRYRVCVMSESRDDFADRMGIRIALAAL